jgi:hypothetical protein
MIHLGISHLASYIVYIHSFAFTLHLPTVRSGLNQLLTKGTKVLLT